MRLKWQGPFAWPGFESETELDSIPNTSGVYLLTFEYKRGFLIYAAGLTRRNFHNRFKEHTRKYMKGEYNVLSVKKAKQGKRVKIWKGWGEARKNQEKFELNKDKILRAVKNQLCNFRIFTVKLDSKTRIPERLEASIMNHLYEKTRTIADPNMQLSLRKKSEKPIIILNISKFSIFGLPKELII